MAKYTLTQPTIEVLKNFAAINPQFIFNEGASQRTCNITRNFIADVELTDPFPVNCAMFDLNRLLNIIDICKGSALPVIDFGENGLIVLHENGTVSLPYANQNVIAAPPKHTYTMVAPAATFKLPETLWSKIKKTAGVLQTTSLRLSVENEKLSVKLINERLKGDESIGWGSFDMPDTVVTPGAKPNSWLVKFDSLEFLPGNYNVVIGDISSSANSGNTNFGVFFTLDAPGKKVTYITAGHVERGKDAK